MGRKAYFALPCVFLTVILTAGCVGQSSHTVSTAEGNEPDRKKSRIIGLIVDDMNDSISFRG